MRKDVSAGHGYVVSVVRTANAPSFDSTAFAYYVHEPRNEIRVRTLRAVLVESESNRLTITRKFLEYKKRGDMKALQF